MNGAEVERNRIARLHVPADDVELVTLRLDVGHQLEVVVLVKPGAVETHRSEALAPAVGAAHAFHDDVARYRVERNPKAHALQTFHTVIRLILMPWGHGAAARLLDQHVVMKKARCLRVHQARGQFPGGRIEHEIAELGNALPVAQVLKERRRAIGWFDRALERAGVGHQGLHAGA